MANSINTKYSTELTFGSTNPVVSGTESDNDTYIVTSNGLSSGTPISCCICQNNSINSFSWC